MGGKVVSVAVLVVIGVIIADILTHPKGTTAFGNASNKSLRATYSALLGKQPK